MRDDSTSTPFRVGFVPGVTLTKWSRVWDDRHPDQPLAIAHIDPADPLAVLRDGSADVVFVRLPVEREGLSVIPLYDEQPVVVVAKEHRLADLGSVSVDDLEGETRFDLDESMPLTTVVEVVETGAGVAVLPQSLARLYGRKGVTTRPVTDLPPTTIALVWLEDLTTDDVSDFIGVVRGRTANSSRGRTPEAEAEAAAPAPRRSPPPKSSTTRSGSGARGARSRGTQRGRGGPRRRG